MSTALPPWRIEARLVLLIACPYCGLRDEIEFRCGGEAHIARPKEPDAVTDETWADYLFRRDNPKGVIAERWFHTYGCRRWFNVLRDTRTHAILKVYRMGAPRPDRGPS